MARSCRETPGVGVWGSWPRKIAISHGRRTIRRSPYRTDSRALLGASLVGERSSAENSVAPRAVIGHDDPTSGRMDRNGSFFCCIPSTMWVNFPRHVRDWDCSIPVRRRVERRVGVRRRANIFERPGAAERPEGRGVDGWMPLARGGAAVSARGGDGTDRSSGGTEKREFFERGSRLLQFCAPSKGDSDYAFSYLR